MKKHIKNSNFHDVTINILNKHNFEASDLKDLTVQYTDAYAEVYNFLTDLCDDSDKKERDNYSGQGSRA
ncbi:MAG: hypothetical protein N4A48_03965 [Tepidibacter sp.]|jgi:hypothetical protein|uniref:hypothetical protein n=1 Tax=Tepidibacter sp. TaxID=2529387 RepID=UPI0025E1412C|nr:hypothetical protein [Tepidibacter sp.]MCT4507905.1 hypothetical protein [Tepidibacter sp.]MCT4606880.1 hypothetical protein [Marinisporobacter sp.]